MNESNQQSIIECVGCTSSWKRGETNLDSSIKNQSYDILGGKQASSFSSDGRRSSHDVILRNLDRTLSFDILEHEQDGRVSMAGTPWEASSVLADYITSSSGDLVDKTVLELGAGIGICTVAAALMGAKVIATDASSTSLRLIRTNIEKYKHEFRYPDVEVLPLLWGDVQSIQLFPVRPDIILASDVVYHGSNKESLQKTINEFCKLENNDSTAETEVMVAHTWRTYPEEDEAYFKSYEQIGFHIRDDIGNTLSLSLKSQSMDSSSIRPHRPPVSIFRMQKRK